MRTHERHDEGETTHKENMQSEGTYGHSLIRIRWPEQTLKVSERLSFRARYIKRRSHLRLFSLYGGYKMGRSTRNGSLSTDFWWLNVSKVAFPW